MNKFCSIFSQALTLQLSSRIDFQQMVKEAKAKRHARGFTCWGQFVAMLFCQLGRAHSLREITGGLRNCGGKLRHLGITAPSRSSLAYANEHRPWEPYQEVFVKLLERCRGQVGGAVKGWGVKVLFRWELDFEGTKCLISVASRLSKRSF